jgi:nicotinamide mononucleotide transporter
LLPLEIAGTALGLLNLWLTIRQNIWCWPVGIACVACFGFVFYEARLYSDFLLQIVYTAVQLYGWWFWVRSGHTGVHSTFRVERINNIRMLKYGAIVTACAICLGAVMARFTNADLPYLDAFPTAISMAAAWMQARKILQSWLFFILGNLLFIYIYAAKGLYVTIALYVLSTILAAFGYLKWLRNRTNEPITNL